MSDRLGELGLADLFEDSPSFLALLRGPEHVFERVNHAYAQLIGHREVIGKPARVALPEIAGQGFFELLDDVFRTGAPYIGRATPVSLMRTPGSPLESRHVDFAFRARRANGAVNGVLVQGTDVTEHVQARLTLEAQREELEQLNEQLQENAVEMELQTEELEVTMQDLSERMAELEAATRRAEFGAAVGGAITSGGALADVMQQCCQAAVQHLDAAFARVWILDDTQQTLVLTASAGQYTHLNGPHGRVPVGKFKIGLIAAERRSHLTNAVVGDPRVSDQEWAAREGMVAFAGHPLLVGDRIVGVIAMFARHLMTPAAFDAFETAATAIAVRISNDRHLEAERNARVAAEAADRGKSDFLSMMSHELRTPLNAIHGFADLLELELGGPLSADQKGYIGRIQRAAGHLQSLIADVLDYAHIGAGRTTFTLQRCNGAQILGDAEMLVGRSASERGLALERDRSEDMAAADTFLYADPEKVRQILVNLLGNAIKFTPAGGRIGTSCVRTGTRLELRVSDTGRGIASTDVARIFEPFVQLDRSRVPAAEAGVGLGLSISRTLARGMNGDLTVTSAPGSGSVFTLSLPVAPPNV